MKKWILGLFVLSFVVAFYQGIMCYQGFKEYEKLA